MQKPILLFALLIVCAVPMYGACEFSTAGSPHDASLMDANRDSDAQDLDPDASPFDGAVVMDAAPQEDAAVEQCAQVGGVCTSNPNAICPPGTRPHGHDDGLDCGGHCCVPDDPSSCNASPVTNCSMSAGCTGCWAPTANTELECHAGRPCCEWICGG